jgi:hypothetical protein
MVAAEMGAIYRTSNRHATSNMQAAENLAVRVGSAPHHHMVGELRTPCFRSFTLALEAIF